MSNQRLGYIGIEHSTQLNARPAGRWHGRPLRVLLCAAATTITPQLNDEI